MNVEEIQDALALAIEGVQAFGLISVLTPIEIGLSDEDEFEYQDVEVLVELLQQRFGFQDTIDPEDQTILLGESDGVELYIQTANSGNIVYFLAPQGYQP